MHTRLPDTVDPFSFAEQGKDLEGYYPLSAMKRLGTHARRSDVAVEAALHFGVDEQGVRYVEGEARAALEVVCQRCLDAMPLPVEAAFRFAFVDRGHTGAYVSEAYDSVEVTAHRLDLRALVEDELMLAMPIVPRHAMGECSAAASVQTQETETAADKSNPFGVLERLKGRKGQ